MLNKLLNKLGYIKSSSVEKTLMDLQNELIEIKIYSVTLEDTIADMTTEAQKLADEVTRKAPKKVAKKVTKKVVKKK